MMSLRMLVIYLLVKHCMTHYWFTPPLSRFTDDENVILIVPSYNNGCQHVENSVYMNKYLVSARRLSNPEDFPPLSVTGAPCFIALSVHELQEGVIRQMTYSNDADNPVTDLGESERILPPMRYRAKLNPLSRASTHKLSVEFGNFTLSAKLRLSPEGKIIGLEGGVYRTLDLMDVGLVAGTDGGELYGGIGVGIASPGGGGRLYLEGREFTDGNVASEIQLDSASGIGTGVITNKNNEKSTYISAGTGTRVMN